jgi:uncharacterized protein YjdB
MKTRIFLLAAFFSCFFLNQKLDAQVESVNYRLKYNVDSCWYDAFIIINAGAATSLVDRTQYNSQYTIVVPTGTGLTMARRYMPLQTSDGLPVPWAVTTSVINPASLSGFDVYSVTVPLSPTSRYNSVSAGDTIKIFSFRLDTIFNCGADIRLWENGSDPASDQPGMLDSDWSNGFTMGDPTQLYAANSTAQHPPKPFILTPPVITCGGGIEIDLTVTTSACQDPLKYAWTGPNSYAGTTQDVSIVPATSLNVGDYKVVVTDSLGCKDSLTIAATNKPNAGPDQTVCAGTTANISGTQPTTGTWAAQPGNPAGATLNLLTAGNAQVTFSNSASGTYRYIYSTTNCSDTMAIFVNPKPIVSITGSTAICVGATTTLSANLVGTWVSNDLSKATVDATTGVVTAVASGTATFTFTVTATGCQSTTNPVTVNPPPTVANTGTPSVCIGSTTSLTPFSGGTWTATPSGIVTIGSGGFVITGQSAGTAKLAFTETATGCKSDSLTIIVTPVPTTNYTGPTTICVNGTSTIEPSSGGTWASSNDLIATINNAGAITGIAPGTVTFRWTDSSTGCLSNISGPLTVVAAPTVTANPPTICAGSTTTLSPTTGGTWSSSNTSVATINNSGVVTGVGSGVAFFTFTLTSSGCSRNTGNIIVNPRPTVLAANPNVCIGGTTTLTPSSGGTWMSLSPGVASVSGNTVTGVTSGPAVMQFTETSSGCTNTLTISVTPRPTVSITGDNSICIGFTTQLAPTTGGSWTSSNGSIATVSNGGLVTGVAVGTITAIYTDATTGCPSLPTDVITIRSKPTVSITGSNAICIGSTTTMAVAPASGGTWYSLFPLVASIHPTTGVITAHTAGFSRFYFVDATGCQSDNSLPVTVNAPPTTSFTGPNSICQGQNTFVSPTSGGTWSSSSTGVATITNLGVITGIAAGTSTLVFTHSGTTCSSTPLTVTVAAKPIVSLTGPSPICIDSTTSVAVTPASAGVWTSSVLSVATVNSSGIVTGIAAGTSTFTFTSSNGCPSDPVVSVAVSPRPTVTLAGPSNICINTTTTLSANTTGTWSSVNSSVATIHPTTGVVTGVAAGTTQFLFTSSDGCRSIPSANITVNPKPIVVNGLATICVGATTQLTPTVGGSWASTDNLIATISSSGLVTGTGVGNATFTFTNATTGCASDPSNPVAVTAGPPVTITDTELCIGETTTLTPSSGGTWESSNPLVATVTTNTGVVTAVNAGLVTFRFTDALGCKSFPTNVLTVHPRPTVSITSSPNICINGTTQLSPSSGGTWVSNHELVATVDNNGVVTGQDPGFATFTFTNTLTTCPSLPTDTVWVTPAPVIGFSGPTEICVSATTTLFPSTGGVWTSSDPTIATVTNAGIVTSIGPGKVTFTFAESGTGCSSSAATDTLTIGHCFNPDFNATFVNVVVPGDVSTNDNVDPTSSYGPNPVPLSNPSGSDHTITMQSDGTYTFTADTEGVYIFNVPVCTPPLTSGCPVTLLTITVRDNLSPDKLPVANTDFATTPRNIAVTLNSLANDRCVVTIGCTLDAASVTVIDAPSHGSTSVNSGTGDITYTPSNGYIGLDTLTYRVCVTAEATNCATAIQIITVNAPTTENTTVAADDFAVTAQDVTITGNVQTNDSDPEGNTQTVTAQTTSIPGGTLTLLSDGSYTFKPDTLFFGPLEYVYRTIDNHPTIPDTAYATLHILVQQDLTIKIRVYLEGAIQSSSDKAADGRPLMRDNLRVSPFNGSRYIPDTDPYRVAANNRYNSTFLAKFTKVAPGDRSDFLTVPDPSTVFAVTGDNAIVDWVFIQLRSKTDNKLVLATRGALLQRDGDVVDLDGVSGLRFPGIAMDDYYVVVRHHRHLGVMCAVPQTPAQLTDLVNFTTDELPNWDYGTSHPTIPAPNDFTGLAQKNGRLSWLNYKAMWAGDFDADGKVKYDAPNDDLNRLQSNVISYPGNNAFTSNFDFAYGYLPGDFDMNSKAKFDNPNDDKNMLYGQVIRYPLNSTNLLSNFDFLIEQLPK